MKTILVTGGAGFIGSHTSLSLIEKGYKVIILDSLINSSFESIKKIQSLSTQIKTNKVDPYSLIEFVQGDIRDSHIIKNIFEKAYNSNNQIDAVIHFAGLKSVHDSINNPINYWENNVLGSINLIKIMEEYKCFRLIFSSSATIYSGENSGLLDENSKVHPNNPYGQTKLAVENMLKDLTINTKSAWEIICLRYFNPIGAHSKGMLGESPKAFSTNIFPIINKVAIGQMDVLEIYGGNYPTQDGTGVRDYIHVEDLADGHIASLEHILDSKCKFSVINLGTGIGTSVLELIKVFEKVNKCKIPYIVSDRREGDLPSVIADNKLAIKLLKWKPKYDLKDMCRDGWNWQKNNSLK